METLIVRVQQGRLHGNKEKTVNGNIFIAFRGVPYARPPTNNLRFRDCEPPDSWVGVRDARKFGDQCAQQDWFTNNIVGSDNCLNLNIYTTTINPQKPKAVMVWIHGGSFTYGSNRDELYGPDYLIEKDIVLVTINYRIGILGFLNADDEEAPGNQGLKDQVQALKWIQQNIAQFGGDPKNVTICGESAGGASVHYLAISPLAQGLFHKAIMQSGVALNPWASSSTSPMDSVKRLAAVLEKDISDIKEFINYLRTLDVHILIEAVEKIRTIQDKIFIIHPFIPSIDSKAKNPFLLLPPEEAAKAGIKVPSICGYLSHEAIILTGVMNSKMYKLMNDDPDNSLIHPTALKFLKKHNLTVNDVKKFYFGDEIISAENNDKIIAILTDIQFVIGLHHMIEIQSLNTNAPMYCYKFEYESEISLAKKCIGINAKGTCHGDELSFLFHPKLQTKFRKNVPHLGSAEYHLIQRFTNLWTNFVKTGNPTPRITDEIPIEWKPVSDSNKYEFLHITENLNMTKETNITQHLINSIKKSRK